MAHNLDRTWMWHPSFREDIPDTSGLFVHFRRRFKLDCQPPSNLVIQITADTKYKLYVNSQQVAFGPVKGDAKLWFYDNVDIGPYLRQGENHIAIHVLRLFINDAYAPSFPRLPSGGLRVKAETENEPFAALLESSEMWETAIDPYSMLRVDEPEDFFLHVYERTSATSENRLTWCLAKLLEFDNQFGHTTPWKLSPRMIPQSRIQRVALKRVHNVKSDIAQEAWQAKLCSNTTTADDQTSLKLPPGSNHSIEVEADGHLTAFIRARFQRPQRRGASLQVMYSESYEDDPGATPWARKKDDRCDYTKGLYGTKDIYQFRGQVNFEPLGYHLNESEREIFMPFHFRTFRFLRIEISAGPDGLAFDDLEVDSVHYPLEVTASFEADQQGSENNKLWQQLWSTSIRTLANCMHDCYEDCPFYEQLQYAMDTRSSALFTYNISGDDRLARQALVQLHNSFDASIGLTASRSPSYRPQVIPHFSLYWIMAVSDHYLHRGDAKFTARFLPVIDAVLAFFETRIGSSGLVHSDPEPGVWYYVDWALEWIPYGVPPAFSRTGISTYTNQIYAYALQVSAGLFRDLGRPAVAEEFLARSEKIVRRESISMSFYTLRALTTAGSTVYNEAFPSFWTVWRKQLSQNLTTWVEDQGGQRSDCHAWGSIPIYEATVEVAGVSPALPGWKAINFSPRIELFPSLEATVPLDMVDGKLRGLVRVTWTKDENAETNLRLCLDIATDETIPVYILIPGHEQVLQGTSGQWDFVIKAA
ncbi:uncharacterized protein FPRO_16011 [Fusarium proliferatum ET1]|uniref:Related to rhamnosidase B n=1 Tax=Fusarium proliferatum (strain ET1) TaxID=1227346 RepID=A0A1L7WB43_FUSPR|nr:uncharacterized protein FPRO_16011 [Fusarium proliferatum ET1]CZR49803.1 related to rhamnosidase B [Fusarium proliferatum ET1]